MSRLSAWLMLLISSGEFFGSCLAGGTLFGVVIDAGDTTDWSPTPGFIKHPPSKGDPKLSNADVDNPVMLNPEALRPRHPTTDTAHIAMSDADAVRLRQFSTDGARPAVVNLEGYRPRHPTTDTVHIEASNVDALRSRHPNTDALRRGGEGLHPAGNNFVPLRHAATNPEVVRPNTANVARPVATSNSEAVRQGMTNSEAIRPAVASNPETGRQYLPESEVIRSGGGSGDAAHARLSAQPLKTAGGETLRAMSTAEAVQKQNPSGTRSRIVSSEYARQGMSIPEPVRSMVFSNIEAIRQEMQNADALRQGKLPTNDAVRQGSSSAEVVRPSMYTNVEGTHQGMNNAEAARQGMYGAEAVRQGMTNAEAVRQGMNNAESARQGMYGAEAVRQGMNNAEAARQGMYGAEAVRQGMYTAEAVRQGMNNAAAARQSVNNADHQGINSAAVARQGLNSAGAARQGMNNAAVARQGMSNTQAVHQGMSNSQAVHQGMSNSQAVHQGMSNAEAVHQGLKSAESMKQTLTSAEAAKQASSNIEVSHQGMNNPQAVRQGTTNAEVVRPVMSSSAESAGPMMASSSDAMRQMMTSNAEAMRQMMASSGETARPPPPNMYAFYPRYSSADNLRIKIPIPETAGAPNGFTFYPRVQNSETIRFGVMNTDAMNSKYPNSDMYRSRPENGLKGGLNVIIAGESQKPAASVQLQINVDESAGKHATNANKSKTLESQNKKLGNEWNFGEVSKPRTIEPPPKPNSGVYMMRISEESVEGVVVKGTTSEPKHWDDNLSQSPVFEDHVSPGKDSYADMKKPSTDIPFVNAEATGEAATTLDPVDEEIKQVLEVLPKLPDLTFADNNTRLIFQKDPEEAALDDRITQVARQLAETSLRQGQQQPQLAFKAMTLPQHIYNGPFFIPLELSSQSSAEAKDLSNFPELTYSSATDEKPEVSTKLSPATDIATILHLGPRYVLPTAKNVGRNQIPLFFDLTPREQVQPFYTENDLNDHPLREVI